MLLLLRPAGLEEYLKVEHVAPVVAYLCHESFPENGTVLESAGGWISKGQPIARKLVCLASSFVL